MTARGFALFSTAIGWCGIGWGDRGVTGVQLPEGSAANTRCRMAARFPDTAESLPPQEIQRAMANMVALLRGDAVDLSGIQLDMENTPDFDRRVYDATRTVQSGKTITYGDLAIRLGLSGAAQTVGQALGRNPFAIVVPCHRVVASDGKVGGFSANGGVTTKRRMLIIEGALADELPLF
jgi:methylated-DNA-[protein]-cysteine S-methyltransferase